MSNVNNIINTGGRIDVLLNDSEETISLIIRKFYIEAVTGNKIILIEEEFDAPNTGGSVFMDGVYSPIAIDITGGETIEFEFEVISSGPLNSQLEVQFDYIEFYSNGTANAVWAYSDIFPVSAKYLTFQLFSPDIKLIDFLTGIFKIFNLTAYVDNNEIVVRTLAEYYNSGGSHNITRFIDTKTSVISAAFDYNNIYAISLVVT